MLQASLVTIILLAAMASEQSKQAVAVDPVTAEIESQMNLWLDAYERGDVAEMAELFMENGIYAANTGEVLRGRKAIQEGVTGWLSYRPAGVTLDVRRETVRISIVGEIAHELFRFTVQAVQPGCVEDAGHALAVWRRQPNDKWLIETLLVNRDAEPPAGACGL